MDLSTVNNNVYIAGVALLLLNIGSRHLMGDIGKFLEGVLSHDVVKKIVLLALFFVATRNVVVSLVLTVVTCIIIYGLFNEKSKYSLVPVDGDIKKYILKYYKGNEGWS